MHAGKAFCRAGRCAAHNNSRVLFLYPQMLPAGFSPPGHKFPQRCRHCVRAMQTSPLAFLLEQTTAFLFRSQVWPQQFPGVPATSCIPWGAGVGLLPLSSACCLPCFFPGTPFFSAPPTSSQVRGVLVVPSSPSSDPKRLKAAGLWAGSHLTPDALPTGHKVPSFPPRCHLSSQQLDPSCLFLPGAPSPPCLLFCSPILGFPAPPGAPVPSKGQQMKGVAVRGGLRLPTPPWNSVISSVPRKPV